MKTIGKMEKRKEDKPLGLNDHLTFGKHKGKKISTAIDIDRRYVIWIKDKNFIKLNEEAEDYLSGIINANGYEDEEINDIFNEVVGKQIRNLRNDI